MTEGTLPQRTAATTMTVGDILWEARRGKLRVPDFQTGLRWEKSHVANLFDSIVRGFPVGGLLLWKRSCPTETIRFGPVLVPDAPAGEALYIVDGQQRVTALVGALLHPDEIPLGDTYALWVDLDDSTFQAQRERPGATWIPVNLLGDRVRLQQWARGFTAGEDTDRLVDRAFQLEEAIIRYDVTAYVVELDDERDTDALRLIFSRTNTSGVALTEDQVFEALFGDSAKAPKPIASLATALEHETGFGSLPHGWLLRCVKSVARLDPRSTFSETKRPPAEIMRRTEEALRRSIAFLQNEAGFIHASVLPYRFPLIVLARVFDQFPSPDARSRRLLVRWVWRGALAGEHSDSSDAAVRSHMQAIGEDEDVSVQELLAKVPRESQLPTSRTAWRGASAVTRLFATTMIHHGPLDAYTEEPVDREALLDALSKRELGQVFRAVTQSEVNVPIAARVLLPKGFLRRDLPELGAEVLASLVILEDAANALLAGDDAAFVAARARTLDEALANLVALRAAPSESDRPPIQALLRRVP